MSLRHVLARCAATTSKALDYMVEVVAAQRCSYPSIDASDARMNALYREWTECADAVQLRPVRKLTPVIDPRSCFGATGEGASFEVRQCTLVSAALLLARRSADAHGGSGVYVGSGLPMQYTDDSTSLSTMLINIHVGTSGQAHRYEYGMDYRDAMYSWPQSTVVFLTHVDDTPATSLFDMAESETHGCGVAYWNIMAQTASTHKDAERKWVVHASGMEVNPSRYYDVGTAARIAPPHVGGGPRATHAREDPLFPLHSDSMISHAHLTCGFSFSVESFPWTVS